MAWKHPFSPFPKMAMVVSPAGNVMVQIFGIQKVLCLLTILRRAVLSMKSIMPTCWSTSKNQTPKRPDKRAPTRSTRAHESLFLMAAVCERGFELAYQPLYSPGLVLYYSHMFPNTKQNTHIAGNQQRSGYDVISAADDYDDAS